MRILIVKTRLHPGTIRLDRLMKTEPLELEYLYTALEDYDVSILDQYTSTRTLLKKCRSLQPDIVLFTAYITQTNCALQDATAIKKWYPKIKIFIGGPHAEVVPHHFFAPSIDGVVVGNHLKTIQAIVNCIAQHQPYYAVAGAYFNRNGQFIIAAEADPQSLILPHPKRILLNNRSNKFSFVHYLDCASIKTSWGCTGACTFCFCREMNGGRYAARPIEDVVTEIAGIQNQTIFIVDDNFCINEQRLIRFAELTALQGIKKTFIAYATAHFVAHHRDCIGQLVKAGLSALIVGLEYIDTHCLDAVSKHATLQENNDTIALCQYFGIELFALFIVDPDWEPDNFRALARYIKKHHIQYATFSTQTLFPGTVAYGQQSYSSDVMRTHASQLWRFDLLRLHKRPKHMSPLRYYLWLFYLYMLPSLTFASLAKLINRCGFRKTVQIISINCVVGIEFFWKLLWWR